MQKNQATMDQILPIDWIESSCLILLVEGSEVTLLEEEEALLTSNCSEKRRSQFALGRTAARKALETLGSSPAPILRLGERAPAWPEGIVGSISHTDTLAGALVGFERSWSGLGLDIENLERPRSQPAEALASKILTSDEALRYPAPSMEEVLIHFSAKEAIYKALFPLVKTDFWHRDASIQQVQGNQWIGTLHIDLNARFKKGTELDLKIHRTDEFIFSACFTN